MERSPRLHVSLLMPAQAMASPSRLVMHGGCLQNGYTGGPCPARDAWRLDLDTADAAQVGAIFHKWGPVECTAVQPGPVNSRKCRKGTRGLSSSRDIENRYDKRRYCAVCLPCPPACSVLSEVVVRVAHREAFSTTESMGSDKNPPSTQL